MISAGFLGFIKRPALQVVTLPLSGRTADYNSDDRQRQRA